MEGAGEDPYLWVTVDEGTTPRRIVVRGELDAGSAGELVASIEAAGHADGGVALDLAAVTFLDSSGLRSLIEAARQAEEAGSRLQVMAASESVRRVFDLTGTNDLLAP